MSAYKIAHISPDAAQKIQELEMDLDVCAIAMEPGLDLAELSDHELERVRALEIDLGVNLIVYRKC